MRKTYTTDLSDAEWTRLRALPATQKPGKPRNSYRRDVLDVIFYVLKAAVLGSFCPMTGLCSLPFTTISEGSD
jgi:transposase